jgi:SAM-dependent methyltransferase
MALEPGAVVLDAGCGTGNHSVRLAGRGYRTAAVDISEGALRQARSAALELGLSGRLSFLCQELENLSFRDAAFDALYCRGVLMHVPDWRTALKNLIRVLKPGGRVFLQESNHRSVETRLVLAGRRFKPRLDSRLERTPDGLEFWADREGPPVLARVADVSSLVGALESEGVRVLDRFSTEFWDLNRFRPGLLRNLAIRFNRIWFGLRLPAGPSGSIGIIGDKAR